MLWLALHLPRLPLEAFDIAVADDSPGRCVVDERCVCVADAAAQSAGIVPGMAAATARALQPGLQVLAREPAREAQCLHLLALALARYTPHLVLETNGAPGVLLEIASSLRLFGGPRALLAALRRTVDGCGLSARVGLGPTAQAAWLFACLAPGDDASGPRQGSHARPVQHVTLRAWTLDAAHALLDAAPLAPALAVLQADARLAGLLEGIGCRNLGDVRALPRAGFKRRGGTELLRRLDAAYGVAPDPQTWFEPPLTFSIAIELLQRADDAAMVGFAAHRLVQAFAGWLAQQWLAAASFSLWLEHETAGRHARPPTRLRIELGQPSRDAAQLGLLLRERLQRCELPAPAYGLKLELDEAVALAGREGRLPWGRDAGGPPPQDVPTLLDRLSARLGPDRVRRLALRADHRPERAAAAVPARGLDGTRDLDTAADPAAPLRPAWLLPEPLPLAEQGGRPVHGGPLLLRTKAERIEAGWFDGALACRDYHVAEGRDHRLRWVYLERRGTEAQWYLHGLFG